MTDIVQVHPFASTTLAANGAPARTPVAAVAKGDRLREWLDLFIKTEQVANVLAKTTFVPKAMQNRPAEVAAAMMRGFEMDIDPLDALGHMHVINGKVGYSAEFMRRRIIEAGHEILFPETTDSRAVLKGRRREHAGDESKWQTFIFTEENARKAKIDLGGYPADKLVARASSRMCRRMFPEVLAGASIAEDLIDAVIIEGGDVTSLSDLPDEMRPTTTRAVGAAQRKRQPRAATTPPAAPAPQPAASQLDELLDENAAISEHEAQLEAEFAESEQSEQSVDPDVSDEPPATRPQVQKLSILRQQAGITDDDLGRAEWFQKVATIIGRHISSHKELTKAEASVLIDALENPEPTT
jgi:hypothetical protein